MKKKIIETIVSIVVVLSLLCSCSDKSINNGEDKESQASIAAAQQEEIETNEPESTETPEVTITPEPTVKPVKKGNFRVGNWGDSKEKVEENENADFLVENNNQLIYQCEVENIEMLVGYYFDENDKLYQGFYASLNEHTNDSLYIGDYNKLKDSISSVYGTPEEDKEIPLSSLYKYSDDKGTAVKMGWLALKATWSTEDTNIMLGMNSDNYKITLGIKYSDKNHEEVYDNSGL